MACVCTMQTTTILGSGDGVDGHESVRDWSQSAELHSLRAASRHGREGGPGDPRYLTETVIPAWLFASPT
jgi:hypothetical protein